ncbi:unnamed protein product [Rhodiola kirilowii]
MGGTPPRLIPHEPESTPLQHVEALLVDRDRALKELKQHLRKSQGIMKKQSDEHRRDVKYKVGDFVYVRLQQGKQITVARRDNYKLAPKYYGPYEIIQRIGMVAYKLKMPRESQIHPVFHVSQLKLARAPSGPNYNIQLKWFLGYQPRYEPEALWGVREAAGEREVLIKWSRMPEEDATWESAEYIREQFPDFDLEDKVALWEGSNDGNPPQEDQAPTSLTRKAQESSAKGTLKALFTTEAREAPAPEGPRTFAPGARGLEATNTSRRLGVFRSSEDKALGQKAPTEHKSRAPSDLSTKAPSQLVRILGEASTYLDATCARGKAQRLASQPKSPTFNDQALLNPHMTVGEPLLLDQPDLTKEEPLGEIHMDLAVGSQAKESLEGSVLLGLNQRSRWEEALLFKE